MQNQVNDIIHIQNLETITKIGIYPHEKTINQPVIMDFKIYTDVKFAAITDCINNTCDYASLSKFIINYVSSNQFNLLETLAENLCNILLKEFNIQQLDLRISKPLALQEISKGALVSIEISRKN